MTALMIKPFRSALFPLLLSLLLAAGLTAPAAHADDPPPAPLPLPLVQMDPSTGSDWAAVQAAAAAEAVSPNSNATPPINGGQPSYRSTQLEQVSFEGDFTPDINHTKLAIHSDDGANVYIDGSEVLSRKGQGQALEKLDQSLYQLSTLNAGQTYHIRIDYQNSTYLGDGDIDGVTLFAYSDLPVVTLDLTGVDDGTATTGVKASGPIKATVTNEPLSTSTCQVTSVEWLWNFEDVQYSADGGATWGDPPNTASYIMTIDDASNPVANFDMTLDQDGDWGVSLTATVTYHTTRGEISATASDWVGQLYTSSSVLPEGRKSFSQKLASYCSHKILKRISCNPTIRPKRKTSSSGEWAWTTDGWNFQSESSANNSSKSDLALGGQSSASAYAETSSNNSGSGITTDGDAGSISIDYNDWLKQVQVNDEGIGFDINAKININYDPNYNQSSSTSHLTKDNQSKLCARYINSTQVLWLFVITGTFCDSPILVADPVFWKSFGQGLLDDFESGAARNRIGGVVEGVGYGVIDSVKGTFQVVTQPGDTLQATVIVIKDPALLAKALNQAASAYMQSAINNPQKFAIQTGVIAGSIALSVVGSKGADKLGKAARIRFFVVTKGTRAARLLAWIPIRPQSTGATRVLTISRSLYPNKAAFYEQAQQQGIRFWVNKLPRPEKVLGTQVDARTMWLTAKKSIPDGYQVDHKIDWQLGGSHQLSNFEPIPASENQGMGAMLGNLLRGSNHGDEVIIKITP